MSSGSLRKAIQKKKADARKRYANQPEKILLAEQRVYECGRKVRFRVKGDASQAAESLFRKVGREIQVYKCRWCEGFHIGKSQAVAKTDDGNGTL